MKRIKWKKNKLAQQLVEFLFAAPILIIFLGILTEYAYALNINMTLSQGIKEVTSTIYSDIEPGMDATSFRTVAKNRLKKYLSENNVPINSENNLQVGCALTNDISVFTVSYTYIPAFTLPNIYIHFLPDKFNFFASAAVPSAFLGKNDYSSTTSTELDKIWSSSADFSTQDSFNASKKGILKDTDGRYRTLFLIKNSEATTIIKATNLNANAYSLVSWAGNALTYNGEVYTVDLNNGSFYHCSSTVCSAATKTFLNYIKSKPYFNLIFADENIANYSNYSSNWAYDCDSGATINTVSADLSAKTACGVLKNSIALINAASKSIGNYDNISTFVYNPDLSTGNSYTMDTFGSIVFMHPISINIDSLKTGNESDFNYNYSFGTRAN